MPVVSDPFLNKPFAKLLTTCLTQCPRSRARTAGRPMRARACGGLAVKGEHWEPNSGAIRDGWGVSG
jgi:hypothetical protein